MVAVASGWGLWWWQVGGLVGFGFLWLMVGGCSL